jgi:hypothetical protein
MQLFFAGAPSVASIALTALALGLGASAAVARERTADVVAFLELSRGTAADEALVAAGVDEFPFRR